MEHAQDGENYHSLPKTKLKKLWNERDVGMSPREKEGGKKMPDPGEES